MQCEWEPFEDRFKCKYCGLIVPIRKIRHRCAVQSTMPLLPDPPGLMRRAANLGKAAVDHLKTGMQHVDDQQKANRFQICQSNQCGLFRTHGNEGGGICAHEDCGCYIRSNGRFMDKLSWATSKCPIGLWGPIEPKNIENPENGV